MCYQLLMRRHLPFAWLVVAWLLVMLQLLSLAAFTANCQPLPSGGLVTSHRSPFAALVVGWLLWCCLLAPPAFVIACHFATINTLIAGGFCHQSLTAALTRSHHQPLPILLFLLLVGCCVVIRHLRL
jgi:hypothetical protein